MSKMEKILADLASMPDATQTIITGEDAFEALLWAIVSQKKTEFLDEFTVSILEQLHERGELGSGFQNSKSVRQLVSQVTQLSEDALIQLQTLYLEEPDS